MRVLEVLGDRDSLAEASSVEVPSHALNRSSVPDVPGHEFLTVSRGAYPFLCCHSTKNEGIRIEEVICMSQVRSEIGERIQGLGGISWVAAVLPYPEPAHVGFVRRTFIGDVVCDQAQAPAEMQFKTTVLADVLAPSELASRPIAFLPELENETGGTKDRVENARPSD